MPELQPHKTIAIVTDEPGWHGRQLKQAFASRGYCGLYVSASDCRLQTVAGQPSIMFPELAGALPAGVFVRGIPGGTLEQVILRLNILHALEAQGVVVYNNGRSLERTVDKAFTSFLLKQAGLPTPDTWMCESRSQARTILMKELARGQQLVLKPLFGSQGEGLMLLHDVEDLPDEEAVCGVYYLQRFVSRPRADWQDIRVFVINGQPVAAMRRFASHWITNRAQGGQCEAMVIDRHLRHLVEETVRVIDIPYAGIDLLIDEHENYLLSEVNSIPAWRGLQGTCRESIAELLVEDFLRHIDAAQSVRISS